MVMVPVAVTQTPLPVTFTPSPIILTSPCVEKIFIGEEELIPTLPLVRIVNMEAAAALELTTTKGFSVPLPRTANLAIGVVVLTPTLPLARTVKILEVCAESTLNTDEVAVDEAKTESAP